MIWIRIFDLIGSGSAFLVLTAVLIALLRQKAIGHRRLLVCSVAFCGLRVVSSYAGALDLYLGIFTLAIWFRTISAIFAVFYCCVVVASKDDLLITLWTTEQAEAIRKDIKRDLEQMQMNREYLSHMTLTASKHLVREQRQILEQRTSP